MLPEGDRGARHIHAIDTARWCRNAGRCNNGAMDATIKQGAFFHFNRHGNRVVCIWLELADFDICPGVIINCGKKLCVNLMFT